MRYLKELPEGTIWPHLIEGIRESAERELRSYIASRKHDVERGSETPELAALLVDKYASGIAKAFEIAGIESDVTKIADEEVRKIDPDFEAHRQARWEARPASIATS